MNIKKLDKSDLNEGLTIDFVNNIDLNKNHSPVLFSFNDDPVKTLKCSNGYWVSFGFDDMAKDKDGKLIVFSEREIQIARARFLLRNPEIEKPKIKAPIEPEENTPQPMFTARFNNPEEMKVLKNVFGREALESADFNMDTIRENLAKEQLLSALRKQ